jgi:amidophosphoribosyltransferase
VRPRELIVVDRDGLRSTQLTPSDEKLDIFEFVYVARPDSILLGQRVNEVRRKLGVNLAREHPVEADIIVPVPDSAASRRIGLFPGDRDPA